MPKRIIIITPCFTKWNHGYSLTSVIEDQIRMLVRYGHSVKVLVGETFDVSEVSIGGVKFLPIMPVLEEAVDYRRYDDLWENKQHIRCAKILSPYLSEIIKDDDFVITHDIVFTGWNLPFFHGLKEAHLTCPCYHWIHSMPTAMFDWWDISSMGNNHNIVIPNRSHRQLSAEAYHTTVENVVYIPHIRDIRTFLDFGAEAIGFIDKFPKVLQADIVQIYPASSDRFTHKGVRDLIYLFREFKTMDFTVCLVIANQWATGRQRQEDMEDYIDTAQNNGLGPNEFILTSYYDPPNYELGLNQKFLKDLLALANVFIFPTFVEAFGLVLPEAILASGALPVVNSHLEVMSEVLEGRGMRFGFGSWTNGLAKPHGKQWYKSVASAIAARLQNEESVACRSLVRQEYNMDTIYKKYYMPIIEGNRAWKV